MVEKLTITRLGEIQNKSGVSQKTGKPYNFNVVGFQAAGKEGWINFNFNGEHHSLEVGKEYEFTLSSREYNGKTYWSGAFPKSQDRTDEKIEKILNILVSHKIILEEIKATVLAKKSPYPTAEDEGIDLDVPF